MPPSVSINLCCYNSEKYLCETLDSIVNQTFTDWELVIIDDGSSDSTGTIINDYLKQGYPITYHYQENRGLGYSRNEALKRSKGEFIAFIDHDDIWLPQKLEKQIPLFEDENIAMVFCDSTVFTNTRDLYNIFRTYKPPRGRIFGELLKKYFLYIVSVVVRKTALDQLDELFDPAFSFAEEMDVFLRIAYNNKLDYIDEPLAKWRMHSESGSNKMYHLLAVERENILEKLLLTHKDIRCTYANEIYEYKKTMQRRFAINELLHGNSTKARKHLRGTISGDKKNLMLFLSAFLPNGWFLFIWNLIKHKLIPYTIKM